LAALDEMGEITELGEGEMRVAEGEEVERSVGRCAVEFIPTGT
jgi:hypothetical protein